MELIRDNLIQNGISFPTKSFEKYEDCFFVSERLASLSWFLFVNNVSGSTIGEGYALFPQQTYKQKIRSLVYAEYVDVGKDFAGMMLPRRRTTEDVEGNFNFLSKSQARVSPFGEQYSKVESAGNEFLDLVKKSQETVEENDFDSWDDFDVDTVEEPESKDVGVDVESQTGVDIANLVEDEDGFLVDEDSLKADGGDSSGFEDDSNERDGWVSEDSEDDFDDWGRGDSEEDEFESWDNSDKDEDEFESWDNPNDNSDEDEFESWGTDDSEVEDDADFDDWGSSDDDEGDSDDWESHNEEIEDDFDDWGSSDETDDSDFDDWGSSNDSEELEPDFEDDADFDDWGSDEEDEPEEELEDDSDFDGWGSSDEDGEEEDFDDWGSSEEDKPKVTKGTPSKQVKRSPVSELKAETEMMDFFERGVNSLFRSTVSNGKKFGRRFASLPENEEK